MTNHSAVNFTVQYWKHVTILTMLFVWSINFPSVDYLHLVQETLNKFHSIVGLLLFLFCIGLYHPLMPPWVKLFQARYFLYDCIF